MEEICFVVKAVVFINLLWICVKGDTSMLPVLAIVGGSGTHISTSNCHWKIEWKLCQSLCCPLVPEWNKHR